MKKTFISLIIPILAFLFVASAVSQETPRKIPRLFGIYSPQLGAWAEYTVFDKTTGKITLMRMSIVGKEGESYWYEVANEEPHGRNVVKMLVKGDPHDQENIQRLIIKTGNNPAQEMPMDFVMMGRKMAGHMFEQRSGIPIKPKVLLTNKLIGKGKAVVPAGEINITKNQIVDDAGNVYARYKFSPDIHPLGVVSTDTEISSMVLMDYGTDAISVITEEPVKMLLPPGMPEGLPRGGPPGFSGPREEMNMPYQGK